MDKNWNCRGNRMACDNQINSRAKNDSICYHAMLCLLLPWSMSKSTGTKHFFVWLAQRSVIKERRKGPEVFQGFRLRQSRKKGVSEFEASGFGQPPLAFSPHGITPTPTPPKKTEFLVVLMQKSDQRSFCAFVVSPSHMKMFLSCMEEGLWQTSSAWRRRLTSFVCNPPPPLACASIPIGIAGFPLFCLLGNHLYIGLQGHHKIRTHRRRKKPFHQIKLSKLTKLNKIMVAGLPYRTN